MLSSLQARAKETAKQLSSAASVALDDLSSPLKSSDGGKQSKDGVKGENGESSEYTQVPKARLKALMKEYKKLKALVEEHGLNQGKYCGLVRSFEVPKNTTL